MVKASFDITGILCLGCTKGIDVSVSKLPGIGEISFDITTKILIVNFDPSKTNISQIIKRVEAVGFYARIRTENDNDNPGKVLVERFKDWIRKKQEHA